ncbi:SDR family NAD(P)-dependent oxidoreductase [Albibacterium bauzanense]|uniref:NAD(P)-dependent dehydrogenase (Short-subunit alcohol dehydrogenase family) n=1 Tax=Albibacterium bauzanense TaxID=653929 RepID=A0A4R1LQC3_9SPHI|nr:SDR family oxidoreductase [Albibacterium bauzanense]TCK80657.1 NAD(P)-dependent dehydrogenase (short-subunit alcohol dehydrogenase family) [Albibacterium bauzanense]
MTKAKSKIALVTGGSRGLGRNMALSLAKKGIDVILTYHSNQQKAEEVVAEIQALGQKAMAFQLDAGSIQLFDGFFKQLSERLEEQNGSKKIDFLINNAGTALYAPFTETTEDQFDDALNIHYKGVFFFTQKALPFLNDGGRIINISSGLTRFSFPGSSVYGSMKGAVEVLTKYLAKELGGRRIAVNVVAPGAIETDFGGGRTRDNKEINANIASLTALGRVGLPDDIGGVVSFLCTEDAGWINGQRIEVSGGVAL